VSADETSVAAMAGPKPNSSEETKTVTKNRKKGIPSKNCRNAT
jgi:hypothetical protein